VQAGRRNPEIYYTADADDPLNVLPRKKIKRRTVKKPAAKQLVSNKTYRDKNRGETPVKKQVKKKSRSKQKETVAGNRIKRPTGSNS